MVAFTLKPTFRPISISSKVSHPYLESLNNKTQWFVQRHQVDAPIAHKYAGRIQLNVIKHASPLTTYPQ